MGRCGRSGSDWRQRKRKTGRGRGRSVWADLNWVGWLDWWVWLAGWLVGLAFEFEFDWLNQIQLH